ncbi:MAG: hypothetical protein ACP5UH_02745 [Candidatus Micrarchaeia archaeon]
MERRYEESRATIIDDGDAFLNSEARFSRDISIALAKSIASSSTKILDPTAATGIRGIRYALETDSKSVTFLEINRVAYAALKRNIALNKLKATALNKSLQEFANTTDERFDIIDLDPFGSPAPYIYDIMKISKEGTYMMATATDTAVLCGAHAGACMRIYDSVPIHSEICHEVGLRILIGYIARTAAQFNYGVESVLAFSHRHYMRVMLRFAHGSSSAKNSISMLGYIYQCGSCGYIGHSRGAFPSLLTCPQCGKRLNIGGRLWLGNIYDKGIISTVIRNLEEGSEGMKLIREISGELDTPAFFSIPKMTKLMGIGAISPAKASECLRQQGFKTTPTHMQRDSLKTDASIQDVKRCLAGLNSNK